MLFKSGDLAQLTSVLPGWPNGRRIHPHPSGEVQSLGGKIPWSRKWNLFQYSRWEIPWTEEPGGLHTSPWGSKESDLTEQLSTHAHTHVHWCANYKHPLTQESIR